jgi:lipoate-protein ligase A
MYGRSNLHLLLIILSLIKECTSSNVSKVAGYGIRDRGSSTDRTAIILFDNTLGLALNTIKPSMQKVPSQGIKRPQDRFNHSFPYIANVKDACSFIFTHCVF